MLRSIQFNAVVRGQYHRQIGLSSKFYARERSINTSLSRVTYKRNITFSNPKKWSFTIHSKLLEKKVYFNSIGLITGGLFASQQLYTRDNSLKQRITSFYNDSESFSDFINKSVKRVQYEVKHNDDINALTVLMAANVMVFGLWRYSESNVRLRQFMWKHFACSYDAVVHGRRYHTLITSAFSHITLIHIGCNMFMLWQLGEELLKPTAFFGRMDSGLAQSQFFGSFYKRVRTSALTTKDFLTLYFTSAVVSSALSIIVSNLRGLGSVYTIGASGAVMAIHTLYCLSFPTRELLLMGIWRLDATELLYLTTGLNIVGSMFQRTLPIDCVGHLGGQAVGYLWYKQQHTR